MVTLRSQTHVSPHLGLVPSRVGLCPPSPWVRPTPDSEPQLSRRVAPGCRNRSPGTQVPESGAQTRPAASKSLPEARATVRPMGDA